MSGTPSSYTFGAACALLGASPDEMRTLRQLGLLVADVRGRRHSYPTEALHFTQSLLQLARTQGWPYPTLCWYADLLFASEIGRIVLLPLVTESDSGPRLLAGSWLETPYATAFLKDAMVLASVPIPQVVPVLQSLLSGSVGVGKFWEDSTALRQGSLGPLLTYYEAERHHFPVGEATTGQHFALLILAFATLAPAISSELRQLALETYARLKGSPVEELSLDEQERIRRERVCSTLCAARSNWVWWCPGPL